MGLLTSMFPRTAGAEVHLIRYLARVGDGRRPRVNPAEVLGDICGNLDWLERRL